MKNQEVIPSGKPFTGWHMFAVLVLFFGTIITVNLIMAYYATSTWSGLVVKNSYVASQEFNAKVKDVNAQDALGWKGVLTGSAGKMQWVLNDKSGSPVLASAVTILLRRPVTDTADATVEMSLDATGKWSAANPLKDGNWIAIIDATTLAAADWRETIRFTVKDGAIQ